MGQGSDVKRAMVYFKFIFISLLLGASFIALGGRASAAGTDTISEFYPICLGSAGTFPAATTGADLRTLAPAHQWGTLGSAPRYRLFYYKALTSGVVTISQTNSANVDVDGALWGPFNSLPDMLRTGATTPTSYQNLKASDYLTAAGFTFSSIATVANKYYVFVIANYSGSATNISFNTGVGTTATSDCSILTPGFDIVTSSSPLVTTEGGATVSYTVSLTRPPLSNVTVNVANTTGQTSVGSSTLTFTTANWYIPQTVVVTAVNDLLVDGTLTDTINNNAVSTDAAYNGLSRPLAAQALDNDVLPTVVNGALVAVNVVNQTSYPVGGTCTANDNAITVVITDNATPTAHTSSATTTCALGAYSVALNATGLNQGAVTVASTITDGVNTPIVDTDVTERDTIAPSAPIVIVPALTNDSTPTLSGTCEALATVQVTVNPTGEVLNTTCTAVGSFTATPLTIIPNGAYSATATQTDAAGNLSSVSTVSSGIIDTTPPAAPTVISVNTDLSAPFLTNDSAPDVVVGNVVVGDTVTIAGWTCTPSPATSATVTCTPVTALPEGLTTVTPVATDPAGNSTSASPAVAITVDTTPPAAPAVTVLALTNDSTPTITGTCIALSPVTITVLPTTEVLAATCTAAGTFSATPLTVTPDGAYSATATQLDQAGNISVVSLLSSGVVDTTPPAAPAVTVLALTNDSTPTITGTCIALSPVTITVLSTTEVLAATCTAAGTFSVTPLTVISDGIYSATATQLDPAGNISAVSVVSSGVVDTALPAAPVVATVNSSIVSATVAYLTTDSTPVLTGTGTPGNTVIILDSLSNTVGTATVQADGSWTSVLSVLADGSYVLSSTQTSPAGNTSLPSNIALVTVDTTAPLAPTITDPLSGARLTVTAPSFTGTGEAGNDLRVLGAEGRIICTTQVLATGLWACLSAVDQGEGSHAYTAVQVDVAGNTSPTSIATTIILDISTDGATSLQEDAAPNSGDSNGDGLKDSAQGNVAALPNPNNAGKYATLEVAQSNSCGQINGYSTKAEQQLAAQDSDFDYAMGLFSYSFKCAVPGSSTQVTMILDKKYDTTRWVYRKYNSLTKQYANISQYVTYGTRVVAGVELTTVTITAQDGGPLDEDGLVNGTFVDPSGPSSSVAGLSTTGSNSVTTLSLVGLAVIAAALYTTKKRAPVQK
jgi:large repetitive protein